MGPATKQDVQSIVDASRSRVLERIDRVALKQDIQAIMDCLKGLLNVHQQSQQLLRQAEYQRLQLIRRTHGTTGAASSLQQGRFEQSRPSRVSAPAPDFPSPTQQSGRVAGRLPGAVRRLPANLKTRGITPLVLSDVPSFL
jgi:hypothetical protein